jgi:hypothetical protein
VAAVFESSFRPAPTDAAALEDQKRRVHDIAARMQHLVEAERVRSTAPTPSSTPRVLLTRCIPDGGGDGGALQVLVLTFGEESTAAWLRGLFGRSQRFPAESAVHTTTVLSMPTLVASCRVAAHWLAAAAGEAAQPVLVLYGVGDFSRLALVAACLRRLRGGGGGDSEQQVCSGSGRGRCSRVEARRVPVNGLPRHSVGRVESEEAVRSCERELGAVGTTRERGSCAAPRPRRPSGKQSRPGSTYNVLF